MLEEADSEREVPIFAQYTMKRNNKVNNQNGKEIPEDGNQKKKATYPLPSK